MALLSRILVPVEFSPRCLGSAQYAEALACHFHCDLTLLHVLVPPSFPSYAPDVMAYSSAIEDEGTILRHVQEKLDAFPLSAPAGKQVKREVLQGDPARAIVEFAGGGFDLIVMPTHGYGPFRRFLLGSVTAKVLHDAHCPVWTGPHMESAPAHESLSFHTVLCAVDLRPESRAVLQWAAAFANAYGAQLRVLHVIPLNKAGGFSFELDWHTAFVSRARMDLESLQADLHTNGDALVETGEIPTVVRDAADQFGANLLVIGRGGHGGVLGRLRTNAYAILRESPCPVVAV
jgi:nucleotide-binding universal stress UspA family protein